jgi:hypothetical protein
MTEYDPKADLHRCLQDARDSLLWKLDGLGDTFGRPCADQLPWDESDPMSDMFAVPSESREFVTGLYRRAWAHSDDTIDALPLDAIGHVPWWPAGRNEVTLHHILVRVATETARHADIVRELIDGAAGWTPRQRNLPPDDHPWRQAHHDRVERAAQQAAHATR